MDSRSKLWQEVTPSRFPWEREALAWVREGLPDHEPYRAWANLEFTAEDGSIAEVDLLVVCPGGFFLIEIKSWDGTVEGDAGTWVRHHGGRVETLDSPLLLANRKAKQLASLLRRQPAGRKADIPFLEPLVFLSHPNVVLKLPAPVRQGVVLRDRPATASEAARPGIVALLTGTGPDDPRRGGRPRLDRPAAKAIARALEEAGIRPTQAARRVGDFLLDEILYYGPNYQDWAAHHATLEKVRRRVRIYPSAMAAGAGERSAIERAARREFELLEPIDHPNILKPLAYTQHELGPALVFDEQPEAVRLDHFVAQHATQLSFEQRLEMVRVIGETLQYAHDKRLFHRALAPQSIRVWNPASERPLPRLMNWQAASRSPSADSSDTRDGTTLAGTSHLDSLVEGAASAYLAPEAWTSPQTTPEALDVFSLGAVAFFVFSGRPPAASALELPDRLAPGRGLELASALDGAHPRLCELVEAATQPEVSRRIPSVADFLGYLEMVEEEFAKPEPEPIADPLEARKGDWLEGGFQVESRLGKGSTALVLRVQHEGREEVLKLALDAQADTRIRAEAEVLKRLEHPGIVRLLGTARIGGREALRLESAGERTLAHRLRETGQLQLEQLERFGEDLLVAVDYLEKQGISHRDIKPDNLGVVAVGRNKELHLALFDFSLAGVPPENIHAGTRPYLDPFLGQVKRRRWDLHAERFAAAVTLYEMATGTLPRWGDGKSSPLLLEDEATIESDLFEPPVRTGLTSFFRRALRGEASRRFDNAEEMLEAWRQLFRETERPTTTTTEEAVDQLRAACAHARLETPIALLHLSTRAVNALERIQVYLVRDLLALPVNRLSHLRGVGHKTRRELVEALDLLGNRLRPLLPVVEEPEPPVAGEDEPTFSGLDPIVRQLLPRPERSLATGERRTLEALLGLSEEAPAHPMLWPTQTEVAAAVGRTRARVSQLVVKVRERWNRNRSLLALRHEIVDLLDSHGGAMVVTELFSALLVRRGSVHEEPRRTRIAAAALRAASEVEETRKNPRWTLRRRDGRVFLARTEIDGEALLDYVEQLARRADDLAHAEPLPSPQRVLEALQAVPRPPLAAIPIHPERMLRLAAAASCGAALSSRLELYPRGLAAERALRLASSALLGARELSVDEVRERVRSRYPEAEPLPGRPELDQLLQSTGLELTWSSATRNGAGAYVFPAVGPPGASSSTSFVRHPTTLATQLPLSEIPPAVVDARLFEDRLAQAAREGAYLALVVDPRHLLEVERELARRFPVDLVSLEERWLDAMRVLASESGIDWSFVLARDGLPPESLDAQNLRRFARAALDRVEAALAASSRTWLLTRAGLLARYGQVDFLDRMRARVETVPRAGETGLHGLWVLAPREGDGALPMLDGTPVPAWPNVQTARVPAAWVANLHRTGSVTEFRQDDRAEPGPSPETAS